MNSISLAMHHVRIRRLRQKEFAQIDCFGDNDDDLFVVFQGILAALTKKADDDKEAKQILEVAEIETDGRQIYGIIRTGAYGFSGDLRDVRTNTLAYKKREYHADMMPFYFHFDLPQGRDKGILAVQRTGIFSIHSALGGFLTKELKNQFPDLVLALNLVASKRSDGAGRRQGFGIDRNSFPPLRTVVRYRRRTPTIWNATQEREPRLRHQISRRRVPF